MTENWDEKDTSSAPLDHNITETSNWDDYGESAVLNTENDKNHEHEDMDISKSNGYTSSSNNDAVFDSQGNAKINDDNASSGYQSNNDHRSSKRNGNKKYANRNGDNLKSEKPAVPHKSTKSTYIPPEFEENDDITIEAGLNFEKYDKIEVIASGMDVPQKISTFQSSGLSEILLKNLNNCNYTTPTPIQKYALPIIMNGRDMIASAQTGSGKTVSVKSRSIFFYYLYVC